MAWTSWLHAHSSGLTASYRVRVPQVAVLPPASSGPRLTTTPLPLATVGAINPREGLPPSQSAPMLGVHAKGPPCSGRPLPCKVDLDAGYGPQTALAVPRPLIAFGLNTSTWNQCSPGEPILLWSVNA